MADPRARQFLQGTLAPTQAAAQPVPVVPSPAAPSPMAGGPMSPGLPDLRQQVMSASRQGGGTLSALASDMGLGSLGLSQRIAEREAAEKMRQDLARQERERLAAFAKAPSVSSPIPGESRNDRVKRQARDFLRGGMPEIRTQPSTQPAGSFTQDISEFVTGEGQYEFEHPELVPEGTRGDVRTGLKMLGAAGLSMEPRQLADIALKTLPGSTETADKFGNIVINYGGKDYYVNRPGASQTDLIQLVTQTAAYFPAARLGGARSTLPRRIGATGTASGLTSGGIDLVARMMGAEQGISMPRAGVAAAGGSMFEAMVPVAVFAWRKIFGNPSNFNATTGTLTEAGQAQARKAGLDPDDMGERMSQAFAEEAVDQPNLQAAAGAAQGREFGIPYTRGQTTRGYSQLAREEATRHGAYGEKAGDIMRQFDEEQLARMQAAQGQVQDVVAGGERAAATEAQAALPVVEGIKARAGQLGIQIDEAYETARGQQAQFTGDSLGDLLQRVRTRVEDFDIDPQLHPASTKALANLEKLSGGIKKTEKTRSGLMGLETQETTTLNPATLRQFETERRKLNSLIDSATNNADRAAVRQIKREVDGWLDEAVDNALFSGDDAALNAIKEARGLRREYGQKFEAQKGKQPDEAGKIIQKMIESDPLPEQVVNYIFGRAKLGAKQSTGVVLKRLKKVVGEEAGEWQSLREMGWLRLSQDARGNPLSPNKFAKSFDEAMTSAESVMKTLYSPDEIALMRRFKEAMLRTVTPEKALNPSKSAFTLSRLVRDMTRRTGTAMTFSGQPGMGALFFALARTPSMGAGAAKKATSPFKTRPAKPGLVAPATAITVKEIE